MCGRRSASMASNYERGMYQQLMEVMARLDAVENELKNEKIEHKEDVRRLNLRIHSLETENQKLKDENARLKSIINNDSSNTSLPPSTDQNKSKPSNTFNGREKGGRKPGGQKGHKGSTLTKADIERKLNSGECIHKIKKIGSGKGSYITKYVIDLDVKEVITEIRIYADQDGKYPIPSQYYSDVTYGETIKSIIVDLYSEGVMANDRISAFVNSLSKDSLGLSNGSVYHFCKAFSGKTEPYIFELEEELLNENVVATDATNVTVDGKQCYVRNFSVARTVVYRALKSKALSALEKQRFLEQYTGILIHDHETALYHFGTGHGECNVHIIRYLRKNSEDTKNSWSDEMIQLLCEMNNHRKRAIESGCGSFPTEIISDYENRYKMLIQKGRQENRTTKHKYAKSDENTLLNRMEKYQQNHLLFLHNFEVSFDDNMSERDLRKVKNREKMAGGFRKDSGHEMYCNILTMIETFKRRNMPLLESIKQVFTGTLAMK